MSGLPVNCVTGSPKPLEAIPAGIAVTVSKAPNPIFFAPEPISPSLTISPRPLLKVFAPVTALLAISLTVLGTITLGFNGNGSCDLGLTPPVCPGLALISADCSTVAPEIGGLTI